MSKHQSITLTEGLDALYEQTEQRVRDGVRSAATLDMQRAHGRWWLQEIGADRDLLEIDEELLELVASPRKPPRRAGPNTLRKRFSTMRGLLELAHRRRRIPRLPAFPPIIAPWRPRQRYLKSYADAVRIYEALPLHRAEWFWVCLWTGQHASDVERMTWLDVDLNGRSGEAASSSSLLIRNSKNRKVLGLRVTTPAPLHRMLVAKYARERPRPDQHLVRPWPSRKHTLVHTCYRLGIVPPVNAIDLRHTCATWMVREQGITPSVCAWFGHSSPAMMARSYSHALAPQLRDCTAALDSVEDRLGPSAFSEPNATPGGVPDED